MQSPSACFFTRVSAQFDHENTLKTSFGFQPFDYLICSRLQLVSSLEFQHNSTMKIPTKLHLEFSHLITPYAATFSSFLHQSFSPIQPCKYPQNFTQISAIRSLYMQPSSAHFFTRVSTQFIPVNTHKTSLGFQLFDHPICSHLQLVSSLEFQHNSAMKIPTKLHLDFSHSITIHGSHQIY